MANTKGIRAGRAFVELGVSDKLTAGQPVDVGIAPALEALVVVQPRRQILRDARFPHLSQGIEQPERRRARKCLGQPPTDDPFAIDLGQLLAALPELPFPISYLTTGQNVPDDIEPAVASRLARLVLGMETLRV